VEVRELIAREQIRELVARYAHHADRGRFDDLVELFADDGVLEIDGREALRGRGALRAFLEATRADLREATGSGVVRHHVTTLSIDVTGSDEASGAAYFLVVSERGLDHWGRYRDRYVRTAGVWRFAARRVRIDGFGPGSWAGRRHAAD
jgi:hypothetical protein